MSDNGGNAEGGVSGIARGPGELGSANSTVFCGESWAWMQNTPLRKFKHYTREGGIASPLIAHWPAGIKARGEWRTEPAHLIDIMATCLDVGGAKYPSEYQGRSLPDIEGVSLRPAFDNRPTGRTQPIFWEHEGHAAIREGDWKLYRAGYDASWELFNLKADRTEQNNVAGAHADKVKKLAAQWDAWSTRANVKPWPEGIGYPRKVGQPVPGKKKKGGGKKTAQRPD
jgi:arylsulfatase